MASSLPWAWIMETLADFKPANSHLLQGLMRSAPDFSADSCEIAKERVSLKILEEMMDLIPADGSESIGIGDAPSSSGRNAEIDVSERAVDVLFKVTTSDLTRGAELKHALNQFITRKRACLPKHDLELLKELILRGGHPAAPSLMERSGLAKENRANCLDSGRIPADTIGEYETSKRLEVSNNTADILSLEKNLSTEVVEDGITNFQEGVYNQIPISKLVDEDREHSLAEKVSINDEKAQPVKLTTQPPDDSGKMPLESHLNGVHKTLPLQQDIHQSICVVESHDQRSEPTETSSRSFGDQNTNVNYNLDDEMVANEKRQFISSQNTASRNSQAGNWTEQSFCIKCDEGGQLLTCSGSSCPIAVHEVCLGSPASFEGTDFYCPFCSYTRAHAAYRNTKQKIAIARKALSSFMGRDLVHPKHQKQLPKGAPNKQSEAADNANCSDKIHANKQHSEMIDDHRSTRAIECQQGGEASIDLSDNNVPCREAAASLNSERNGAPLIWEKEGTGTIVDNNQHKTAIEHRHEADFATFCSNDNLPCKEVGTSVIERHDVSSINVERNCVEAVKDSQCIIREAEHQQQKERPTVHNDDSLPCREAETSLVSETHNLTNGKGDTAVMTDNHQCMNGSTQQKRAETRTDNNVGSTPCILVEDSPTTGRLTRAKRKIAVIPQAPHPGTPASGPNIDAEETAGNQNEEDFSSIKRIKRGRAAKRYSNPLMPHLRRTKLLWTTEEEEVLKEAMRKFSNPGQGSLPWTRIMEFGSKVFHKTRTPVDLKDKWRNIMIKEGSTARKK
ncbi:hypothetical protein AAC387_Pa08g0474 [Persea americana]